MKVSIKDIARTAGVSHSTVSRALSNSPLLPESTRRRIQRVAQKMGYAPNAIARGLVTRRTHTIGVIVTTIEDPFVAEVVRGIEEIAANQNYRVFLGTSHNDPTREVNLVKALREWRVDGVIVASSRVGALYQPLLKEIGAQIVLINNQNQSKRTARAKKSTVDIHSVVVDDTQGGELATRFLIAQGHRVIGYLGGPTDYAANRNRLNGYQRALAEANVAYDEALVQPGTGRADSGEQVLSFLARLPALTAVFCYNDMTAIGALSALKHHGRRVPADVSLVGFDDIPFAAYVDPPLTTIHQPKDEMGRLAMRMLLDLLDGKSVTNVMVPGKLIERESTRAVHPGDT
ncbi:MAG: LacI family DNA-binding transcriptional regulator [Chloroflexota bacterium]|nr:LacI family DNA-binding transcriptional regulator [Chloroflexota bacterium]